MTGTYVELRMTEDAIVVNLKCPEHGTIGGVHVDRTHSSFSLVVSMFMLTMGVPLSDDMYLERAELPDFVSVSCAKCLLTLAGDRPDAEVQESSNH